MQVKTNFSSIFIALPCVIFRSFSIRFTGPSKQKRLIAGWAPLVSEIFRWPTQRRLTTKFPDVTFPLFGTEARTGCSKIIWQHGSSCVKRAIISSGHSCTLVVVVVCSVWRESCGALALASHVPSHWAARLGGHLKRTSWQKKEKKSESLLFLDVETKVVAHWSDPIAAGRRSSHSIETKLDFLLFFFRNHFPLDFRTRWIFHSSCRWLSKRDLLSWMPSALLS